MFKAVMIIFVITMGRSGDETPAGILDTKMFETIEQCQFAKEKMDAAIERWHYGKGDNTTEFPVKRTVECHEFPSNAVPKLSTRTSYSMDGHGNFNSGTNSPAAPPSLAADIINAPPQRAESTHERWDQKRWNDK